MAGPYNAMNMQTAQLRTGAGADGMADLTPIQQQHLRGIAQFTGGVLTREPPRQLDAETGIVRFSVSTMPNAEITTAGPKDNNGITSTTLSMPDPNPPADKPSSYIEYNARHDAAEPCLHQTSYTTSWWRMAEALEQTRIVMINGKAAPQYKGVTPTQDDISFHQNTRPEETKMACNNIAMLTSGQTAAPVF